MASGYELLIAAGSSLTGTEILSAEAEPSDDEIARFLSANMDALEQARAALKQECAVPLEYDERFVEKQTEGYFALRDLARGFALELKAAERRGNLARAVAVGLDIFDLADATRRSGLVLDMLVALAIESIAIERLRRIRRRLEPGDAARLANELLRVEKDREPFDDIVIRDREWEDATGCSDDESDCASLDWPEDEDRIDEETKGTIQEMVQFVHNLPDDQQRALQRQPDDKNVALLRLLAIESALLSFRARNGEYPADLSGLTPDCIAAIPRDPFTGGEFKYCQTPTGFIIYSPGPTGQDSGGTFGDWLSVLSGEADLGVDMRDYDDA